MKTQVNQKRIFTIALMLLIVAFFTPLLASERLPSDKDLSSCRIIYVPLKQGFQKRVMDLKNKGFHNSGFKYIRGIKSFKMVLNPSDQINDNEPSTRGEIRKDMKRSQAKGAKRKDKSINIDIESSSKFDSRSKESIIVAESQAKDVVSIHDKISTINAYYSLGESLFMSDDQTKANIDRVLPLMSAHEIQKLAQYHLDNPAYIRPRLDLLSLECVVALLKVNFFSAAFYRYLYKLDRYKIEFLMKEGLLNKEEASRYVSSDVLKFLKSKDIVDQSWMTLRERIERDRRSIINRQ